MELHIPETVIHYPENLYLGQRVRNPTITDVKFIRDDRLVTAHRSACKVYLVDLIDDVLTIVDTLHVTYNGRPHQTEMLDAIGTTVYMICYTELLYIIDILDARGQSKLVVQRIVRINDTPTPYHGIYCAGETVYFTPANCAEGDDRIVLWNSITHVRTYRPSLDTTLRVKGLTQLSSGEFVIVADYKTKTTNVINIGHVSNGTIRLYTSEFVQLDTLEYTHIQFDCIVSQNDIFYATCANATGGYILKGHAVDGKLVELARLSVADFPHGIDIRGSKLAYTSYTTSSMYVLDVF